MKFPILILRALIAGTLVPALHVQASVAAQLTPEQRDAEIRELRAELRSISMRLDALDSQPPALPMDGRDAAGPERALASEPIAATVTATASSAGSQPPAINAADAGNLQFLRDTTLGFAFDGYYGYNFNAPIGRVNLLRAYDVTSNSFNINQVSVIVEHLPTPTDRMGGRIDFQFGQATESLQGSSVNEQRPQVWRNLFQAYGSYLAPVGSGLRIDFGKFASSLGNEGNYTKDQIAYSRAYSFNFLPFYHMGLRTSYNLTPKLNVGYELVNGANQTEDFNGFKSQHFMLILKPGSTLTWNLSYYVGQEARDVQPTLNPGIPGLPTQPGLPTVNRSSAPTGREHIFDTYATWNATPKLTLVPEADFVVNREHPADPPSRVVIGSLAGKYALSTNWNIGARFEYLDDRGGLFSGTTQALKEGTLVLDRLLTPNFVVRAEYRRDFSNQRFFLTDTPGGLVHAQTTATLGLIYWWGTKQGTW